MKGILFTAPMVRAILEGRKVETRRVVNPPPHGVGTCHYCESGFAMQDAEGRCMCVEVKPKYRVGERIYVKETWQDAEEDAAVSYRYRADGDSPGFKWRSALFMPSAAARLFLTITAVAAERLHDITEEGALREGVKASDAAVVCSTVTGRAKVDADLSNTARGAYAALWDTINGKCPGKGWRENPWVWVYTFKRLEKGK